MNVLNRFLNYVQIHTTSDDESQTSPSTGRQFDLAQQLANEMREMGLTNVFLSDSAYVYGSIPATEGYEQRPSLGFIAHIDTSPDVSGANVRPRVTENYDGGELVLLDDPENSVVLSPVRFPHLTKLKGRTLVTTDGTTLLGADDKAGIAEILSACEQLLSSSLPHGKICVAFTPDEEVGRGTADFDLVKFGADFAYTMDGGEEGELEYENFNAAEATIQIKGVAVHPGSAKDIMINALAVACELNALLPGMETPRHTEAREGFYHLHKLEGTTEQVRMGYILRDHDSHRLEGRILTLKHAAKRLNEQYGADVLSVTVREQYRNMYDIIRQNMHLVDNAKTAMAAVGLTPILVPMRGGTDGAQLSYMGLPCPNLGTGGFAYHGVHEHISVEGMEKSTQLILELIRLYSITDKPEN